MNPLAYVTKVRDHGDEYEAVVIWCPAPMRSSIQGECGLHILPISGDASKRPVWEFDGNLEAPTIRASILTRGGENRVCHSFVTAGRWEFLGDCTHALAGQTVPMVSLPDWAMP